MDKSKNIITIFGYILIFGAIVLGIMTIVAGDLGLLSYAGPALIFGIILSFFPKNKSKNLSE